MTPEQRVEWEADIRSLYDGMVRIVVTPTWAKLIDFETTLPSAVEDGPAAGRAQLIEGHAQDSVAVRIRSSGLQGPHLPVRPSLGDPGSRRPVTRR